MAQSLGGLLGFVLLFELIDLLLLSLNLFLLRGNLSLSLVLLVLVVLHRVADCETTYAADRSADGRARSRSTHCCADDRAGCGAGTAPDKGAFFASRERLARASGYHQQRNRSHNHTNCLPYASIHGISLPMFYAEVVPIVFT